MSEIFIDIHLKKGKSFTTLESELKSIKYHHIQIIPYTHWSLFTKAEPIFSQFSLGAYFLIDGEKCYFTWTKIYDKSTQKFLETFFMIEIGDSYELFEKNKSAIVNALESSNSVERIEVTYSDDE